MDLYQKISVLGPGAKYDTCGPKDFGKTTEIPGVYHAKVAGNHICRLFKVLQTNACLNNCRYCAFRRDRACLRVSASPDEMAKAFDSAYSRRLVEGLFLSSGIAGGPDPAMSRMLDTVHLLREKYYYRGYIHLKIMPQSSLSVIRESIKLANRISLNIESPTDESLARLSGEKSLKKGFFHTLSLIKGELKKNFFADKKIPSLTTQFVVGAGDENDGEIVKTTHFLYKNFGLKRVFYSAFRPIDDTPLANRPAVSLVREHRLYQTDFLMRFYHFSPWDIPLDKNGFLSEMEDPKLIWARRNPWFFPVDINKASYWDLIKVPGIGPVSAKKIVQIRRQTKVVSLDRLYNLRFQLSKISPYLKV
ncbi:MAG: radical SAM protein [Patescibacteria group bacterium]|nr:radical SAM protein [Patescibacteria group bacterium]